MSSTREDKTRTILRGAIRASLLAGGALLASTALAEQVSIQFSQIYPGGGTVTGLLVGEDLDGDGQLYSVAPGMADFLGIEPGGDEVTYASVRIEGLLGEPVTNVFDASVADINDQSNFFWGFVYNLDGGPIGDDPDEGLSFAPLAPSTSYTVGELFGRAVSPSVIPDPIRACGNDEGFACSAITTLEPEEPFPNFELLFDATSAAPVVTNELLRYTFDQSGFEGGASVTGTVSGRDLDGDGRLYSVGQSFIDFLGFPPGDEIVYASVTIRGMAPEAIVNVVDLVAGDITDTANFFFGAAVNVAGDQLGDEEGEGISIAPFSPSTTYTAGAIFAPSLDGIASQNIGDCGNAEGAPCGITQTVTPNPDSPFGIDVQAEQFSAAPVAQNAAPLVVDSKFSGHWFNQVPNGEGLIVQIIDDGRALVYWLTYDDSGSQRWLFGIGRREGLKIDVEDVYVTDGGVFGTELPVLVDLDRAGEMELEFAGCSTGVLRSNIDGILGTMDIGRLTGLNGLECVQ